MEWERPAGAIGPIRVHGRRDRCLDSSRTETSFFKVEKGVGPTKKDRQTIQKYQREVYVANLLSSGCCRYSIKLNTENSRKAYDVYY